MCITIFQVKDAFINIHTYLFKVVSGLDSKDEPIVLNKNMMYLDKDCLDSAVDVVIHYELNPENTLNYNNSERDKYLLIHQEDYSNHIDLRIYFLIQMKNLI